jgi:hypothetical protein
VTTPFTLAVGPSSGTRPVQQVTDFDLWTLDNNLDDGCSLTFTTRIDSEAARQIQELITDVWLYRNAVPVQRFRVTSVDLEWDADGRAVANIGSTCYRRLLKKAHVNSTLTFSQVNQGDIVWDLIQHAQAQTNGNLGITLGNAGPTLLRDRTYEVGSNIFDMIFNLSQVIGGITWNVNADLELIVGTQFTFPTQIQPIILGVTARRMVRPSNADKFGNVAIVTGDQEATTVVIEEAVTLAFDPRGRWERLASFPTTILQDSLQEAAEGLIEETISPLTTWEVEMEPDRYFSDVEFEIGEFGTLVVPRSSILPVGSSAEMLTVQTISRSISQTADGDVRVICTFVEVPIS